MRTLSLLFAVIAAVSARSGAQAVRLDASRFRPAADTFYTFVVSGARVDTTGWATQSLTRSSVVPGAVWTQVYRWHGRDGSTSVDSLIVDLSLSPVAEFRQTAAGNVRVTYSASRVRATIEPKAGAVRQVDTSLASAIYASASLDAVARALAPTETTKSIDFYYPFPAPFSFQRITMSVTGAQTIKGPRAIDVSCWVVVAQLPGGATTFWVSKSTGEVIQFDDHEGSTVFRFRRPGAPAA